MEFVGFPEKLKDFVERRTNWLWEITKIGFVGIFIFEVNVVLSFSNIFRHSLNAGDENETIGSMSANQASHVQHIPSCYSSRLRATIELECQQLQIFCLFLERENWRKEIEISLEHSIEIEPAALGASQNKMTLETFLAGKIFLAGELFWSSCRFWFFGRYHRLHPREITQHFKEERNCKFRSCISA